MPTALSPLNLGAAKVTLMPAFSNLLDIYRRRYWLAATPPTISIIFSPEASAAASIILAALRDANLHPLGYPCRMSALLQHPLCLSLWAGEVHMSTLH